MTTADEYDLDVAAVAIWAEIREERIRAHRKHGQTSMESQPPDAWRRYMILAEEVGEVAKEYNEADHEGRPVDLAKLRKELIQVAAMAGAWAAVIPEGRHIDREKGSE